MDIPRLIAHRGLHGGAVTENSLEALENAVKYGLAAEIDVRFTADKKMVVFHDRDTERMCGERLEIADTPFDKLRSLTFLEYGGHIPSLCEALKLVGGRIPLFIELKDAPHVPDAEKRLAHLLKKYGGDLAVQSFDPFALKRLREADPSIMRGQLISRYGGEKELLRRAASSVSVMKHISKPDYVACDLRSVSIESVFGAAGLGARFVSWTADSEELLKAALDFSDSVIFEKIPPLRAIELTK